MSSIISENTQIDLCISLTPFGKLIPVSSLSVIRLKFLRLDNLSFKFTSELINTKNYLIIVDLYKYLLHIWKFCTFNMIKTQIKVYKSTLLLR